MLSIVTFEEHRAYSYLNGIGVHCQLLLLPQLLEVSLPELPHEGDEAAVPRQLHLRHRDRLLHADPVI